MKKNVLENGLKAEKVLVWEDDDEEANPYDNGDDALDEAGESCLWECSVSISEEIHMMYYCDAQILLNRGQTLLSPVRCTYVVDSFTMCYFLRCYVCL